MIKRLAVIKTGWCDSYDGEGVEGNFGHLLKGGHGAERFNMLRIGSGFQVYALPKGGSSPRPTPSDKWTIVHVARDPAAGKMKLVGWYEKADFLQKYVERVAPVDVDRSIYCIEAERAFELLPADRPVIDHDGRFGSSGIFWLRGNVGYKSAKPWETVAARLENLIAASRPLVRSDSYGDVRDTRRALGDTRRTAPIKSGVELDDGGTPFGRGPESPEHEALRIWACATPEHFGGKHQIIDSDTEWPLPLGDRVDAMHRAEGHLWVIEAKSRKSGEKDKERGIFQCVKYRAVAEALQIGQPNKLQIHAILLIEDDLSERLKILAERYRVQYICYRIEN